jgi:hypothetical protein
MAKFLDTRTCAAELSNLIKFSPTPLTLISPFLQLSAEFKQELAYRDAKGAPTTLIVRKEKVKPDDLTHLSELKLVTIRWHKDVHAKSYFDGEKMIITSMNFYEASMTNNNKEMGVLIQKKDPADTQVFTDAMREIEYILAASQRYHSDRSPASPPPVAKNTKPKNKQTGYCIRTGIEIPFNPDKPLCREAYNIWSEFANVDYPEKYCHFSGEPSQGETSVKKPILTKYWKKAKELHGL